MLTMMTMKTTMNDYGVDDDDDDDDDDNDNNRHHYFCILMYNASKSFIVRNRSSACGSDP